MLDDSYLIDAELAPVIMIRSPGRYTDRAIREAFVTMREISARGPYVPVVFGDGALFPPSATQRQLITEETKASPPSLQESSLGVLVISESLLIRGVLTAIAWVLGGTPNTSICGSIAEVHAALERLLPARGLRPPALGALEEKYEALRSRPAGAPRRGRRGHA